MASTEISNGKAAQVNLLEIGTLFVKADQIPEQVFARRLFGAFLRGFPKRIGNPLGCSLVHWLKFRLGGCRRATFRNDVTYGKERLEVLGRFERQPPYIREHSAQGFGHE
jgi:hypothetical protein